MAYKKDDERHHILKTPVEYAEYCRVSLLMRDDCDFESFLTTIGPRPSPAHWVERKDETRPYHLANLEWRVAHQPGVTTPYLTLQEAAAYVRKSPKTLYNWKWQGRLESMPGSRHLLFTKDALDRCLRGEGS